ncbi:hypothetical protein HaLaN_30948, partial [Haematococcus lacustris]
MDAVGHDEKQFREPPPGPLAALLAGGCGAQAAGG